MTTRDSHQLARAFIAALSTGRIPDELLTSDMRVWTISSGEWSDRDRFKSGIKLFASVADHSIVYDIVSLTAEDDRVVAEVKSSGTLNNGDDYWNNHVFILTVRDGKIAEMVEYMNPVIIREKVAPLLQQAMKSSS